jgi:hypothetical protein
MAYRINSTNGKPFANPTALKITLPDGSTTELQVLYRHVPDAQLRRADSKAMQGDADIYAATVVSVAGIEDEQGQPVDPVAAVEAVKADEWLMSAIALGYINAKGETWRRAFAG